MVSEVISLSPMLSSSRTIFDTISSTRSGSTGRLRSAIDSERISLSRSNGTRRPLRLMTTSSRSCTRSKVVKRKLQVRQTRRRRIAAESSVGRESLTWVSSDPQLGQRILPPQRRPEWRNARLLIDREPGEQRLHLLPHRSLGRLVGLRALGRKRVEHLGDQFANMLELGHAKAAAGAGRRAEPDAGRDHWLLRIERDAVLVAGDVGPAE